MADKDAAERLDPRIKALNARLDQISRRVEEIKDLLTEVRQVVGPFGALLGPGRLLVQTLHGLKYLIDPDDLIMTPQLVVYRQWEPELSALVSRTLTADSVFVDVGANFGYFACLAGSRIGPHGRGRVIAIEPNPAMVALLEANIAINWSMSPVEINALAVGERSDRAVLSIPTSKAANASLSVNPAMVEGGQTLAVEVKPLDLVVPDGLVVDLLKIDVEGHETAVLLGADRVLSQSPNITIVLEWSKAQMSEAGYEPRALIQLITRLGLAAYAISPDGAASEHLTADRLEATAYANIVLRHPPPA